MNQRPRLHSEPSQQACDQCALQFSWLTLAANSGLGVLKIAIGIMAGSKALIASALYSINNVLSAMVVIISMRIARRAPDDSHPYGYGKAEFVAVSLVSVILAGAVVYVIVHSLVVLVGGMAAPPHLIVLPVAEKSHSSFAGVVARMRTDTDDPTASVICEAIVRRQMSS